MVDEESTLASNLQTAFAQNFSVTTCTSLDDVAHEKFPVAVVIAPGGRSSAICATAMERGVAERVVILGAEPSLDEAISAIRAGASDFLSHGSDSASIIARVSEIWAAVELSTDMARIRSETVTPPEFPEIIGESDAVQRLRERLKRVASSDVSVLITGENGTGKDTVAHAIHYYGRRPNGPYVAANCSTIPQQQIEGELFGFVKGAFPGAAGDRPGLLVEASGGTIYLDEISELPFDLQAKLLRAIQEKRVRPLGQGSEVQYDARLIASSSVELEKEIATGRFRKDLFFRLNVVRVHLPPIRERSRDVLLLAQHFIRSASSELKPVVGFTPAVARALLAYKWPGNVRELQHCITSAVNVAHHDHITTHDLPPSLREAVNSVREDTIELMPLHERERLHILEILQSVEGNKSLAARHLGLDRKTLARKLRAYERLSSTEGTDEPSQTRVPLGSR